jgi:hypothetical protein
MKRTIMGDGALKPVFLALIFAAAMPALAQESTTKNIQKSESAGAKGSIEMGYSTWFMQAAGAHGSPRVKNCVAVTGKYYGAKVAQGDPWGVPGLSAKSDTFREASVCTHALNAIAAAGTG